MTNIEDIVGEFSWPRMCGVDRIVGEYLDATVTEPEGWGEV